MLIRSENAKTYIDFLDSYKNATISADEFSRILSQISIDFIENDYNNSKFCGVTVFNEPGQPILFGSISIHPTTPMSVQPDSSEQQKQVFESIIKSNPRTRKPPASKTPKKIVISINSPVKTPKDLIAILDQNSPLDPTAEYNIDLPALANIRSELVELDAMIGMRELKESIVEQLLYFMMFERSTETPGGDFKHTVLYGPPGTGKTEIAKIIGNMYSKIGILKKQVFKKVTRGDLVAGYLGQTAIKTRNVIEDCLGGVLFIDEAYSLSHSGETDSFSKECIDTLCEALSNHKENLMVIIAGYETELERDFFSTNPGLDSRFIWRFKIDPYSATELREIFSKKVDESGWELNSEEVAPASWFHQHKSKFKHFGRDMELLFFYTKIAHTKRIFGLPKELHKRITQEDLDAGITTFMKNKKPENRIQKHVLESMYI
jgi:Cdc6-like AAA superfamily ATPase